MAFADSIKTSALILPMFVSVLPVYAHADNEKCGSEVTAAVAEHFRLKDLRSESGKVVTEHCKNWSTDTERIIALFVYDDSPKKRLLLALINSRTNAVLSSYSGRMPEEDAVTRVGEGSARLDTAPYVLSPMVPAFGVVFDTTWLPCAVSGGTSQELQLFIGEGKRIRPIFNGSTPIHYWRRETTDCFNPGETFSTPVTLAVLKTASNGFFDLRMTARESKDFPDPQHVAVKKRSFSYTVKYDGSTYDLSFWQKKFSCWYDKGDCRP